MQKLWLDLRKDVSKKVLIVNEWQAKYQNLLSLLTEISGQTEVQRSIEKLKETEEAVERFYESDVQAHAQAEDLGKLTATKHQFDQFIN